MRRPSVEQLPTRLACGVRELATVLARAGHRAWLVGGAVRDLALGIEPRDADLASAARPEELIALFPRTHAVGRAFGTVVVHQDALDFEVTTFRAESGYDDARRPTHVRFSTELEEDAARRDFTCNALYLDPLNDELVDPTGGLADLGAGRLRCVGEPLERFREDGLRLLRLARLAAEHGLEVEPATASGARQALAALRGVSAERVLAELARMAEGACPARAVELLLGLGLWPLLPGLGSLDAPEVRLEALRRLEGRSQARFFATLLGPARQTELGAQQALLALRPSRALQKGVAGILALANELESCLELLVDGAPRRSRWIRLVRANEFADTVAFWRAWNPERLVRPQTRLADLAGGVSATALWPAPLVTSMELEKARIPRGPRWKELLEAAEDLQLDGVLTSPEAARVWLAGQEVPRVP